MCLYDLLLCPCTIMCLYDLFSCPCSVAKQIAPSGDNEDLNLNDPALFVMYGIAPTGSGAGALGPHNFGAGNPLLSTGTVNPLVSEGDQSNVFPMAALLRAHGILMLIAWPLLAVSGIFFAAWMRPALPNGEWFQVSAWVKIDARMCKRCF